MAELVEEHAFNVPRIEIEFLENTRTALDHGDGGLVLPKRLQHTALPYSYFAELQPYFCQYK